MQLIQEIFMESISHSKSLVLFQFHTSINLQMGNFEEEEKPLKDEEYLYTYEEDPIIEIRFKRDTEELTTRSENEITKSSTTEPALVEPSSNAFPKSLNNNLRRRNRRLKKNLSRNRRMRKALRKDKKFLSNRT